MSARLFDRLAAGASMLILVGLGMASYYFAKKAETQGQQAPPVANRPDPDYFVERMALMRADANGDPSVRVEAERMLHYPLSGRIAFTNPLIITLDERRPLMTARADRGEAADTGDFADLMDNVQVLRAATEREPSMQVDTQAARVDLDRKTISSDQPVEITAGDNRLQGVGMEISEQARQLELKQRVRGHFPAARPSRDASQSRQKP
ncbi:MAG: LPS export ABC transporter periplasmic protein LptC [Lautropia sp.]|nr:LPS export ABC transporter periplasmic protein LptC [Lautropia sp.]